MADDHLKSGLPPVITATFRLIPQLLAAQIMIQNTLLAQYYTTLHTYSEEASFPETPPSASEIMSAWDADFKPVKHSIETGIPCVAGGKTVRQPMRIEEQQYGSVTGLNIRNGISNHRKPSSHGDQPYISTTGMNVRNGIAERRHVSNQSNAIMPAPSGVNASSERPSPDPYPRPRISSVPSQTSLSLAIPSHDSSAATSPSPGDPSTHAPAGPRADYFGRDRLPSNSSMASIAAGKKKPPPPPPKRLPSNQGLWVTALYEFAGQGQGDLSFREGDRIRVVKKTESTDDWWEGELRGVQGSFPANYCHPV